VIGPAGWAKVQDEPGADTVPIELRDAVLAGTCTIASAPRDLIVAADLNGDLHGHSDWSDGHATILEMAHAARDRGDSWYLVSDHSAPYAMVGGLGPERLLAQAEEIAAANAQLQREHEIDGAPAFRLLQGSEVEILADGALGLPDTALAKLDWVVASIHVAQRQSAEAVLERMRRVIANPLVDAIGHPTSRRLLRRERTALDVDVLIELAADSDAVLEINANPDRLDLDSAHAAQALAAGVRLTINTDAHRPANLDLRMHGIAVARRAGVRARDVVNCLPIDELLASRRRDR
jgi:DNA polymerase (family 10)